MNACRMRVCKVDPISGVPIPGDNLYVTDSLVSVDFSWEIEKGTEINEKGGCGTVFVYFRAPDTLKWGTITLTVFGGDPYLAAVLSGGEVLDVASDRKGYAAPPLGVVNSDPVSIEVWGNRIDNARLDADYPYAWWVYPQVQHLRPDNHKQEAGAWQPPFVGEAVQNPNWFNGPTNDWPSTSDRPFQWVPATTMPDASCGPVAVAAS